MKQRPSKPLFLIDASVPRNIDERVAALDNVFLYNMDDVSNIANENLKTRIAEVDRCKMALSKRAFQLWEQIKAYPSEPSSNNHFSLPFRDPLSNLVNFWAISFDLLLLMPSHQTGFFWILSGSDLA